MFKEWLYGKHQVRIFRSFSKQSVKSDLRVPLHFALNSVLQINCIPVCFTKLNNTATEINNSRRRQSQQVIGSGKHCFQLRFKMKWQNYSALFYTTGQRFSANSTIPESCQTISKINQTRRIVERVQWPEPYRHNFIWIWTWVPLQTVLSRENQV